MWNHQKRDTPVEGDMVMEWKGAGEPEKEKGCIQEMADAGWNELQEAYKNMKREAKAAVAIAKNEAYRGSSKSKSYCSLWHVKRHIRSCQ